MQATTKRRAGLAAAALACLCALVLALCALAPASADETTNETSIKITVEDGTAGTYYLYQVLSGDFTTDDDDNQVINNAVLNDDIADYVLQALDNCGVSTDNETYTTWTAYGAVAGDDDDDVISTSAFTREVVDAIAGLEDATDFANTLAGLLASATDVSAQSTVSLTEEGDVEFAVNETGYYLVFQTVSSDDSDATATTALLQIAGTSSTVTVTAKTSTPTADKSVVADDAGNYVTFTTDNDGNTTATVSYEVTGTVASNIAAYDSYYYAFVDTMPSGIEISEDLSDVEWTIMIDETDVTSSFSTSVTANDSDQSVVTWYVKDLLSLTNADGEAVSVDANSEIVLSYTVTISSEEVESLFGANSTTNELVNVAYVEFSHSPYEEGTGTTPETGDEGDTTDEDGNTEEDGSFNVYKVTVNKVDEYGEALSGAQFTLTDSEGNEVGYDATSYDDDGNASTFVFTGLAEGTYTLTETESPDGYDAIEDVTFTISSSEVTEGGVTVTVAESSDASDAATEEVDENNSNNVVVTVTNYESTSLPLTGAQGIALGILVGGVVIALSVIAIVRNHKDEEEIA